MRLTAFQSDKGDCLLLEDGAGKHRMLIDGGMAAAYRPHVAPAMGRLRKAGKALDVVYVSHIDEDHISGVLQLLDDEAAWRVHDHQVKTGNPNHPAPSTARPPDIGAIFHNSFEDQIRRNRGPIEDMLAATARTLSGCEDPWLADVAQSRRELVASIPQAMRVSQRIKPGQLNIPLNPDFDGKLMMIDPADPVPDLSLGRSRCGSLARSARTSTSSAKNGTTGWRSTRRSSRPSATRPDEIGATWVPPTSTPCSTPCCGPPTRSAPSR